MWLNQEKKWRSWILTIYGMLQHEWLHVILNWQNIIRRFEKASTFIIDTLMLILGVETIATAISVLVLHKQPEIRIASLIISSANDPHMAPETINADSCECCKVANECDSDKVQIIGKSLDVEDQKQRPW